jgi:hypothetical protein
MRHAHSGSGTASACYAAAVLRAVALAALGTIGCGRLNFSAPPPPADGGPIDAPPIPGSICGVDRIHFDAMPATGDLAITGTTEGYAAVWIDPSRAMPAQGLLLEQNHLERARPVLSTVKDTRLGTIIDVGQTLVLSTGDGTFQTTWIVSRDLLTATPGTPLADHVMAHGQYPSDTNKTPRVFVTATGAEVTAAYIGEDGLINTASTVSRGTSQPVTDLACADGPDHSHCVWVEALPTLDGASQCTATDVRLLPVPSIPGGPIMSGDCYDVRTSSGPDQADSMIVVWTTADHRVEMRYVGGGGLDTSQHTVATTGSAPKVQFDGSVFWIAWLDGQGVLQLTSFDGQGTLAYYSLPGWVPLGPEAFELVRRRNQTALVLLSRAGLEFLTICP